MIDGLSVLMIVLVFAWIMTIIQKTFRERIAIIDAIYLHVVNDLDKIDQAMTKVKSAEELNKLKAELEKVSEKDLLLWRDFEKVGATQHFCYNLFFRNPMNLYSEEVRSVLISRTVPTGNGVSERKS